MNGKVVALWAVVLMALSILAIINVFGFIVGTMVVIFSFFLFVIVFILAIAGLVYFFYSHNKDEGEACLVMATVVLVFLVVFSFVRTIDGGNRGDRYIVAERGDRVMLLTGAYLPCWSKSNTYVTEGIEIDTVVRAASSVDGLEREWSAICHVSFGATREETLNIIAKVGTRENWVAQVRRVFVDGARMASAETLRNSGKTFPASFEVSLPQESTNQLKELGYHFQGQIKLSNVILIRSSQ